MHKQAVTIIVTDSGLGGISVAAELFATCRRERPYEKVEILFFNALFDEQGGYQMLERLEQQVEIFNAALYGMLAYQPDMILLACNTLSVLYPYTEFSRSITLPVFGIVEIGVNYILQEIAAQPKEAVIMLFATPVTIQQGTHKRLLAQHLPEERIIEQACPGLAHAIGDGNQIEIQQLIEKYVGEAIQKLDINPQTLYVSLQCTHFGYYEQAFAEAFLRQGLPNVRILNPNREMVKAVCRKHTPAAAQTEVHIAFVSKVHFHEQGMASLIPFLRTYAEEIVEAFKNYRYDPNLF